MFRSFSKMPVTFGSRNPPTVDNPTIGGDRLTSLPVDQVPPSPEEVHLMEVFFKEKKSKIDQLFHHGKDLIILGLIFVCLSLPQTEILIKKFCPSASSFPTMVAIKTVLLVFVFAVVQNIYLAKTA